MIAIRCATCGEASQIDEAWIGRWVGCPHCRRPTLATATTAATAAQTVVPPPPPPTVPPMATGSPTPPVISTPASPGSRQGAAEPANTLASPIPSRPAESAEPPAKRAPLTRGQRLAIRRRRHLMLAIGGAIILLATAYALLSFGN